MAGFTAFIDESGCDGFSFDRGSSDFLVVAAIICRTENLAQYDAAVAEARVACRKPENWKFKSFKDLGSVPQRWALVERFAAKACRCVAVAIYKPALIEQGWADNPGDLYFHASKYLLERISWACRDTNKVKAVNDPRVRIVFSERRGLRYDAFRNYLIRLRNDQGNYNTNTEWAHIDPEIVHPREHDDTDAQLLAADYLASSLGLALERKDQGVFDDRFARLWARKFYRHKAKVIGNGFKVWPDEGLSFLSNEARGEWMKLAMGWSARV